MILKALLKYSYQFNPNYKINFLTQIEYILKGENDITLEKEIFNMRTSNFMV